MKTNHKIGSVFLKLFCLGTGTFLGILCLLFWFFIVKDFSGVGLVGIICISVISIGGISAGSGLFRTIEIDEGTKMISVTAWRIFRKEWTRNEISGYKIESYATKYGDFERTLIGTKNGDQICIFESSPKNSSDYK